MGLWNVRLWLRLWQRGKDLMMTGQVGWRGARCAEAGSVLGACDAVHGRPWWWPYAAGPAGDPAQLETCHIDPQSHKQGRTNHHLGLTSAGESSNQGDRLHCSCRTEASAMGGWVSCRPRMPHQPLVCEVTVGRDHRCEVGGKVQCCARECERFDHSDQRARRCLWV